MGMTDTTTDLASIFCDLRPDDQVLALRILPRRTAATLFEYLPHLRGTLL